MNTIMTDEKNEWFGASLQTPGMPMVDKGLGKPLVLRTFEFAVKFSNEKPPTRQELFNSHWPQIKNIIWGDGLVANTDVNPRIVIGKRRYRIFVLCEPKFRVMVADKPQTLQQVFNKKLAK